MSSTAGSIGFWPGCFNHRMDALIRRFQGRQFDLVRASTARILAALDSLRTRLPLADNAAVCRMLDKNPDIIRLACEPHTGAVAGLFAYLPLNEFGAWTVANGCFDGGRPDPAWICRPDERPVALTFWLVDAEHQLGRILGAIARLFRALQPQGCLVLSRGATLASAKIQRSVGFRAATDFLPGAPANLMAARPSTSVPMQAAADPWTTPRPAICVRPAQTLEDLAKVFSVRSATFQGEQACPYDEEFDGNDLCATQLLAQVGNDAAGCIRIRYFGDFAKLERLAVRREYRNSRVSSLLVEAALHHCARKGFSRIYGHSRADLVGFWHRHGFAVMSGRSAFRFSDVEYVEIETVLEPDPTAIRLGVDPMMSIRPEGRWDEPGPLDKSLMRAHATACGAA